VSIAGEKAGRVTTEAQRLRGRQGMGFITKAPRGGISTEGTEEEESTEKREFERWRNKFTAPPSPCSPNLFLLRVSPPPWCLGGQIDFAFLCASVVNPVLP
jgi:hypothetical protein